MLSIDCPYCGARDETEFEWGGPAHLARPDAPDAASDEVWGRYLFFRENPKGLSRERWVHRAGCGQWFNLVRDTRTHAILAAYRIGEPPPADPLPESGR